MHRYNFTNPLFLLKIESMMRRFYILLCLVLLVACDDGDIITVDLEFDKELDYCDNNVDSFLIYDLREDPNESLSVIVPRASNQEYPFTEPTPTNTPINLTINEDTNRFIYRTYNRALGNDELCDPITPADLNIIEDYETDTGGSIIITVTIDDDDDDGIPSDLEGRGEMDENGNYPDAEDSDGDGIPDYQDQDDDNDNVLTEFETGEIDENGNPTLDTDGDLILDYLDTDDDGDGTNTILEDENGDKNPRNDQNTNSEGLLIAHYLNPLEVMPYASPGLLNDNQYTRTVTASFLISGNLEILSATEIDFGILTYPIIIIQEEEED
ncbi:hypothetical protein FBALC1_11177 [Flavobacteriales bacterium ALC-1]|nr:hypothetical protein FBALC1_11177 [Flavobacteriales bacterium ALC-1]